MTGKIIVVMGVSGTGKTTVGKLLSNRTKLPFFDADDFHPKRNIEKMQAGQPLDDQDRAPWLQLLAQNIADWRKGGGAILACSALKEKYRQTLSGSDTASISWVFLDGSFDLLLARMSNRKGHFMPKDLLESQLATLERPANAITIDVSASPEDIITQILPQLKV